MIVAIDGPAGAGKSSVARALAVRLGFRYLDTGAMYRALTWLALRARRRARRRAGARSSSRASTRSSSATAAASRSRGTTSRREIREPEIDSAVPIVARHPEVREVMRERQRALGEQGDSVIEGRDIGVVVAPHAEREGLARRRSRGARRAAPRRAGRDRRSNELADEMRRRDERDAANTHRADDAVEVDTTLLSLEQVIDRIEALVRERVA